MKTREIGGRRHFADRAFPRLAGLGLDALAEFSLVRPQQRGSTSDDLAPLGGWQPAPPFRGSNGDVHGTRRFGGPTASDLREDAVIRRPTFLEGARTSRSADPTSSVVDPVEDFVWIHA